ncbi:hypothetical protein H3H36_14510 [Duganella sp. FT3S]|uniref:Beta-ketoacyl synthase N-terminal domain-containing protein n=1 Tax=Rugamonas fusca TaxID=2758568 RepID=A0A7W2EIL2_9BURK|nr:hypothetical protein [Rugamonas fusca]MBA5606566.1 hypothetical protein [Rugamonas fusca]
MKAQLLHNGPYLHALGWLQHDYRVVARTLGEAWQGTDNPVVFDGAGAYALRPGPRLPDDLPPAVARGSGVARSRSAAKSTVYAAMVGKCLLQTLAASHIDGQRLGVAIAATSDTTGISLEFETVGVRDGWHRTDTMLLPSSIPSAITTQTSAVFDTHAAAIAFDDGARGMCAALEYAYLSFLHGRADAFLVIGADEICPVHAQALEALGDGRPRVSGAAGMVLTRAPLAASEHWQLAICAQAAAGEAIELPGDWDDAARLAINLPNAMNNLTAALLPLAMQQLLSGATQRALLLFNMDSAGGSRFVLGLQRRA